MSLFISTHTLLSIFILKKAPKYKTNKAVGTTRNGKRTIQGKRSSTVKFENQQNILGKNKWCTMTAVNKGIQQ